MKKLILFCAFFSFVAFSVNAQKACPYSKKTADSTEKVCSKTAAAKLAATDESITEKVCATSGNVSYVKKSVCAKSGNVSYQEVKYCSKSSAFVNVSPSAEMAAKKTSCSKKDKAACAKSCAAKKAAAAKATKVSGKESSCTPAQKAKCAKEGKSCAKTCAAKKAAAEAQKQKASNVKLVKSENE